jgi:hypothetical protein
LLGSSGEHQRARGRRRAPPERRKLYESARLSSLLVKHIYHELEFIRRSLVKLLGAWQVKEEIISEERSALGAAHTLRALASCRTGVDSQASSPPSHFTPPDKFPETGKRATSAGASSENVAGKGGGSAKGGGGGGGVAGGQGASPSGSVSPPSGNRRGEEGRGATGGGSGAARARSVKSKLNNYRTLLTSNSRSSV